MRLDLLNDVFNNFKERKFVKNFINEMSNYLENNLNFKSEEIPIIEEILSKNNLTTGNKNTIIWKERDIILEYVEKFRNDKSIYFVKDSKKTYWLDNKKHYDNDVYKVLKIENSKIEEVEISKKDMPKNIGINDVFTIENGSYICDNVATKELKKEIINMTKEIIDRQNINLDKHRKEGHLYLVTEKLNNNLFLWDLIDSPKIEFEEVNISENLSNSIRAGMVLKYINGKYEYYSDDGFEIVNKIYPSS